jgi:hypothetical protein
MKARAQENARASSKSGQTLPFGNFVTSKVCLYALAVGRGTPRSLPDERGQKQVPQVANSGKWWQMRRLSTTRGGREAAARSGSPVRAVKHSQQRRQLYPAGVMFGQPTTLPPTACTVCRVRWIGCSLQSSANDVRGRGNSWTLGPMQTIVGPLFPAGDCGPLSHQMRSLNELS